MTSTVTVTVTACCGSDKEVRVKVEEDNQPTMDQVLEDGESRSFTFYDTQTIMVGEYEKEIVEQGDDTGAEPNEDGNTEAPPE